eukprot:5806834-Pleurochrysis_carterae.AAC.1
MPVTAVSTKTRAKKPTFDDTPELIRPERAATSPYHCSHRRLRPSDTLFKHHITDTSLPLLPVASSMDHPSLCIVAPSRNERMSNSVRQVLAYIRYQIHLVEAGNLCCHDSQHLGMTGARATIADDDRRPAMAAQRLPSFDLGMCALCDLDARR